MCVSAQVNLSLAFSPDKLPFCVAPAAISERAAERNMHHSINSHKNKELQQVHTVLQATAKSIPDSMTVVSTGMNPFIHISALKRTSLRQMQINTSKKHP